MEVLRAGSGVEMQGRWMKGRVAKRGVSGARDGPAHYITLLVNWKLGRLGCSVTAKEGERKEYGKDKKRAPWRKPEAGMARRPKVVCNGWN